MSELKLEYNLRSQDALRARSHLLLENLRLLFLRRSGFLKEGGVNVLVLVVINTPSFAHF
jgi:hypothetical protein